MATARLRAHRFWILAAFWASAACGGRADTGHDREFLVAVKHFQAGRTSEAFGRFTDLANRGDVDAARIALFMHGYGPILFGKHWDASEADTDHWRRLARHGPAAPMRPLPPFVPVLPARPR